MQVVLCCASCSVEINRDQPGRRYCPPCGAVRNKIRGLAYKVRKGRKDGTPYGHRVECSVCGKPSTGRTGAKYCNECRGKARAAQRERAAKKYQAKFSTPTGTNIRCQRCSNEFPSRQGQNKYCVLCRTDANKERDKAAWIAKTGAVAVGSVLVCMDCGARLVKERPHQRRCEICRAMRRKEKFRRYRDKHPKRIAEIQSASGRRKRAKPEYKEKSRRWAKQFAMRNAANFKYRLNNRMSQLVKSGLKSGKQGKSWRDLVSFTPEQLHIHIERQFLPGMSWENMGEWHIDHILPLALFDFSTPVDAGFKAAWQITNLRPLWATDNLKKNAKRLFLI